MPALIDILEAIFLFFKNAIIPSSAPPAEDNVSTVLPDISLSEQAKKKIQEKK